MEYYLAIKNEWSIITHYGTNEPLKYAKWKKLVTTHVLCDSVYVNVQNRQIHRSVVTGGRQREKCKLVIGPGFFFGTDEKHSKFR